MILFSLTTFLSSFLLFTVQLIVGKRILPWFGGVASVWTTTMLFFMFFLFLGYLYVSFISRLTKHLQIKIHLSIVGLSFLLASFNYFRYHTLILPNPDWISAITQSPSSQILILVIASLGLPYFLLSTTSTLLQYWFVQANPTKSPFFLYVISNIGSFLGLLFYPFVIESKLTLTSQENQWLILFAVYILLMIGISKIIGKPSVKMVKSKLQLVSKTQIIHWTTLSAISNIALLATTSHITQSISPVPFLWIVPLALYLVSFIIAFSGSQWYSRQFHFVLMLASVFGAVLVTSKAIYLPYWTSLTVILTALFMVNLVCHAELFKNRPRPESLVPFYIAIAFGGVLAALFCAILAPSAFPDFWELPLSFLFSVLVYIVVMIITVDRVPVGVQHIIVGALLFFLILNRFQYLYLPINQSPYSQEIYKSRNFYGLLTITDQNNPNSTPVRYLTNGIIEHGNQRLTAPESSEPTSYYTRDSGVGLAIDNHPKRQAKQPMRIGVIGLGAGTMAAYCQSGDYFRFYEINPDVIEISRKYFTYLSQCQSNGAELDIVLGDARLSLAKEKELGALQKFDVLVVDAFTDDAIPVHLITKESIELFASHLTDGGLIAFHISNQFLTLDKVLNQASQTMGLYSTIHDSNSQWYLVSPWLLKAPFQLTSPTVTQEIKLWTDDYSNILEVMR